MDHVLAYKLFAALAKRALGDDVAKTLSLPAGRIWLANALFAAEQTVTTVQRYCRWALADSALTYQRVGAKEYNAMILKASHADITRVNPDDVPITDFDSRFCDIGNLSEDDEANDISFAAQPHDTRNMPVSVGLPAALVASKRPRYGKGRHMPDDVPARHNPMAPLTDSVSTSVVLDDVSSSSLPISTHEDIWNTDSMTVVLESALSLDKVNALTATKHTPCATLLFSTADVAQWYRCVVLKVKPIWPDIRLENGRRGKVTWAKLRFFRDTPDR